MFKCDSILIDHRTLAIESVFTGGYKSRIHTTYGTFYSTMDAYKLIDLACIRFASSIKGRKHAARQLLSYWRKTPVIIAPYTIGAFPTAASKKAECVWIFNHHFHLEESGKGISRVTFMNGTSIRVQASEHTITQQQLKLHTLLSITKSLQYEQGVNFGENPAAMRGY